MPETLQTTYTLLDGKKVSSEIKQEIAEKVTARKKHNKKIPHLAIILVGDDGASQTYVDHKVKACKDVGFHYTTMRFADTISEERLMKHIDHVNKDDDVDGFIVQLPLPAHISVEKITEKIRSDKDVDGFHPLNVGRLSSSAPGAPLDFPVPCTPLGVSMLLHETLGSLTGRHAVVIGRSNLVGRPVAQLLLRADCTVTIAHSRTRDLPALCRQADILVAAIGRPQFVRGRWIKPGASVIDVGINRILAEEGMSPLVGDVAFAEALPVAGHLTPVPGGVGPMTVACLMFNTWQAARRSSGLAVNAAEQPHLPVGLGESAKGKGAIRPWSNHGARLEPAGSQ